jgi:hypothetical protein
MALGFAPPAILTGMQGTMVDVKTADGVASIF